MVWEIDLNEDFGFAHGYGNHYVFPYSTPIQFSKNFDEIIIQENT
jgi:hypothetical protein